MMVPSGGDGVAKPAQREHFKHGRSIFYQVLNINSLMLSEFSQRLKHMSRNK